MTAGVPVVAANRGALPEVLGDAGILIDPQQPSAIADAIATMIDDAAFAARAVDKGLAQSKKFSWTLTAAGIVDVYRQAIAHRERTTCVSA